MLSADVRQKASSVEWVRTTWVAGYRFSPNLLAVNSVAARRFLAALNKPVVEYYLGFCATYLGRDQRDDAHHPSPDSAMIPSIVVSEEYCVRGCCVDCFLHHTVHQIAPANFQGNGCAISCLSNPV